MDNDNAPVHYSNDGTETQQRFTVHGLMAKLTLDGKGDVRINYHTKGTPQAAESASMGRFSISANRAKMWVCAKPQVEPAPGSPDDQGKQRVLWHQLLRFLPAAHVINKFFCLAWEVKLETVAGQNVIAFERPILEWRQAMLLKKDTFFRWG